MPLEATTDRRVFLFSGEGARPVTLWVTMGAACGGVGAGAALDTAILYSG